MNLLTRNNFTVKVDHNLGAKDKLSGRYIYNSDDSGNTSVYPERGGRHQHRHPAPPAVLVCSWTRVITPSLINEFRFTYGNRINHAFSYGIGGNWPSKLGIKGVPDNAFPQIVATGFANLGNAAQERRQFPIEQHQYVENLSWIRGRHAFKFGTELRSSRNYESNRPPLPARSPSTRCRPVSRAWRPAATVWPRCCSVSRPGSRCGRRRCWTARAGTWPDSCRTTGPCARTLTLNLGLRWETDTPIMDAGRPHEQLRPPCDQPGLGHARRGPVRRRERLAIQSVRDQLAQFRPAHRFRLEAAGELRTVVRGGFGVFFAHPFDSGQPTSASLGYEKSAALNTPDNGITAPFYLKDGPPGVTPRRPSSTTLLAR